MFPYNQNSNIYTGTDSFIFFSFSQNNETLIKNMINDLCLKKCHIWYDRGIENGVEWDEVAERISSCTLFLAFIDNAFLMSHTCKSELNFAEKMNCNLLFVLLEDISVQTNLFTNYPENFFINFKNHSSVEGFYDALFANPLFSICNDFYRANFINQSNMPQNPSPFVTINSDIITIQTDSSKPTVMHNNISEEDMADYISFLKSVTSVSVGISPKILADNMYEFDKIFFLNLTYFNNGEFSPENFTDNRPKSAVFSTNEITFFDHNDNRIHSISYKELINRYEYSWTDDSSVFNNYHSIYLKDLKEDIIFFSIFNDLTQLADGEFDLKNNGYSMINGLSPYLSQAFPEYFKRLKRYFKEPLYRRERIYEGMDIPRDATIHFAYDNSITLNGDEGFVITDIGIYCKTPTDKHLYYFSFSDLKNGGSLERKDRNTLLLQDKPIAYFKSADFPPINRIFEDLKNFI